MENFDWSNTLGGGKIFPVIKQYIENITALTYA